MNEKMKVDDAVLALAASVAGRACELLTDGWVKGRLNGGEGGAEEFCIHGALNLAIEEVFGQTDACGRVYVCGGYAATDRGRGDVEAIATAFIVDEAANQFAYDSNGWKHGSLGAAAFNDAVERKHAEVLSVVGGASKRLWDLSLEQDGQADWTPSKWAMTDVDSEQAQQYLHASLAS